jgi:dihydrodipicolinate synthase/N-acetylneuraminate lyase
MNNMNMVRPLKGIIPPLVTPLLDSDTLDKEGLERLIGHVIKGGVHGVFILGTTGEAQSLSYRLRGELIQETCRIVNSRIPVLVGISDTSIVESLNLSKKAADYGASAVVSAPPYYYATAQPELTDFYQQLTKELPLPLFLYNMPTHTKVNFSPATIRKLAENPKIIGFKDSSANGAYFQLVCYEMKENKNFSLLVGPEEMTAEAILMGGHGGVNGGANMFPSLYVDLYNAAIARDFDKIKILQEKVLGISRSIYNVGHYGSSYLKGVKCVLGLLGICSDFMAQPFFHFLPKEREIVQNALVELGFGDLLKK